MAALVEAPEDIRPDGELYEKIVDHAYDYFNARLIARWNRVLRFWNGDDKPHGVAKPIKMEDYFRQNQQRDHNNVNFSRPLLDYLREQNNREGGIQLDADWYRRQVREDYKKVGNILDYDAPLGVISVKQLIEKRFADRLDEREFSAQEELQRQTPPEMRAPTPQPVTDLDYYNQWGFESLNLMRQELAKLNPWGRQGLALTQRDVEDIQRIMDAANARDDGRYEKERIREAQDEQRDHREEMQWIEAHDNMSMEEYIVSLKARWNSGILTDDEQAILTKYVEDEDISEDGAFEYAQDAFDEDGETGQAIIERDQAEIVRLNQAIATLRTEAATTQTVPFLDGQLNSIERNFTGARAIRTAKDAVSTLRSKRAAIARKNPEIQRLQAKINFAERFYAGIDAIFQNDVNVPSVANWRERNYNGGPLIRYVVWGVSKYLLHSPDFIDDLIFRNQASFIQRTQGLDTVSLENIAHTILTDRLRITYLNPDNILRVSADDAARYKEIISPSSPKMNVNDDDGEIEEGVLFHTPQKEGFAQDPGTVKRAPSSKRKGKGKDEGQEQEYPQKPPKKANLKKRGNLKVNTDPKQSMLPFIPDPNISGKRESRPPSRRAGQTAVKKKSPTSRSPSITEHFNTSKPFTIRGSPPPIGGGPPNQGGDGKVRAKREERDGGSSSSNRMDTGQEMLNNLNLKF